MPLLKCLDCHHEWEATAVPGKQLRDTCDWCGAGSRVLKEKTELEMMFAGDKWWRTHFGRRKRLGDAQ